MKNCPKYTKAYREANKEKIKEFLRVYRKKNELTLKIYEQLRRLAFPEKNAANQRRYMANSEYAREKRKSYSKEYYKKNALTINRKVKDKRDRANYGDFSCVFNEVSKLQKEILCQEKRQQKRV